MKWILPLLVFALCSRAYCAPALDKLLQIEGPIIHKIDLELDADLGAAADVGSAKEFSLKYNGNYTQFTVAKDLKGSLFKRSILTSLDDQSLKVTLLEADEYMGVGNIDVFVILYSEFFLENDTYLDDTVELSSGNAQRKYDYYGDKVTLSANLKELNASDLVSEIKFYSNECRPGTSFRSLSLSDFMSTKKWEQSHFACSQLYVIRTELTKLGFDKPEVDSIFSELKSL